MSKNGSSGLSPPLSADQESFVTAVMSAKPPSVHILQAPTGTGKSMAAVEVVRRVSLEQPQCRALFLCPAVLVRQFADRLSISCEDLKVIALDRARYRELEAASSIGASPFVPSTVAIVSIDLAKHSDVARGVLATPWDVVVVDEAQGLSGERGRFVRMLLDANMTKRTIFISASSIDNLGAPNAIVTKWAEPAFDLQPTSSVLRSISVRYTEAELSVFRQARDLASALKQAGIPIVDRLVRSSACSSLYSLERVARNLRHLRADTNNAKPEEPSDAESVPAEILDRVERLLSGLDAVAADSKLDALVSLLNSRIAAPHSQPTIVISHYTNTVSYLVAALADRGLAARALTGDLAFGEASRIIQQIPDPGVTVMTFASLRGLALPPIRSWVFYEGVDAREQDIALSHSRQRTTPVEVIELKHPIASQ